ncbi:hypothetical protein GcM1_244135 [Golovinomyces cichoracearum]|uniref:Uncharacterized protein n=1 Tax=Golovinomyces cichoracearum TaxID=62708 RepID=A0A420IG28_9PEZI|nr:hypothetical protein GcM1_244135 [Golovinomyces cichoracearum]
MEGSPVNEAQKLSILHDHVLASDTSNVRPTSNRFESTNILSVNMTSILSPECMAAEQLISLSQRSKKCPGQFRDLEVAEILFLLRGTRPIP